VLVLVSIEPHVYKQTIGAAIRMVRPRLEVRLVEPEDLKVEVARVNPGVVIGALPETATAGARYAWVEFKPYEDPAAYIRVCARHWVLHDVDFEGLLSVVDEAERIACMDEG
jgi:hypothetical protein